MYYTDKQLIDRAKQVEGFEKIPSGVWLLFVRASEDSQKPNEFNDVAYIMLGERSIHETTCTTVPGLPALQGGYKRYNIKGACVLKADKWMHNAFKYGKHAGRMPALRQVKKLWSYRDGDGDSRAEQLGLPSFGMWHTNIHAAKWNIWADFVVKLIGHWSYGCIVYNRTKDYRYMLSATKDLPDVTALILNEFSI